MKKYALHIPAELKLASPVREIAVKIFREVGFSEKEVTRLKLVFDEIFMNAVKYGSVEGSILYITFEFKDKTLGISFEDEGGKTHVSAEELEKIIAYQKSNVSPTKSSGRGLAQIAGKWSDELRVWNSSKGGLCIYFSKQIGSSGKADEKQNEKNTSDNTTATLPNLPQKILELSGELDNVALPGQVKMITEALADIRKPTMVVLDLKNLKFLNSSMIAQMVAWQQGLQAKEGLLVMKNVPPAIVEVFELVGIPKVIQIFPSELPQ